jgi:hypothetical protein
VTEADLDGVGLNAFAPIFVEALRGVDAPGVLAAVRIAIAERVHRPPPRLDLVWSGPETRASVARSTSLVVKELFDSAIRHVIVGGYAFDDPEILRPLHRAMKERNVNASLLRSPKCSPHSSTWEVSRGFRSRCTCCSSSSSRGSSREGRRGTRNARADADGCSSAARADGWGWGLGCIGCLRGEWAVVGHAFTVANPLYEIHNNGAFDPDRSASLIRLARHGFHDGGAVATYEFFVSDPDARWVARNLLDEMRAEDVPGGIRVDRRVDVRELGGGVGAWRGFFAESESVECGVVAGGVAGDCGGVPGDREDARDGDQGDEVGEFVLSDCGRGRRVSWGGDLRWWDGAGPIRICV